MMQTTFCEDNERNTRQLINDLLYKMIRESDGNRHDIAHLLKVYSYARLIAEQEGVDAETKETLEIAAIIHDIACPICREKYGNASGKNQEKESAPLVRKFLEETSIADTMKERIEYLVCHHHTYTNVDGLDYRILLEADFLVNADEGEKSTEAIQNARERIFETKSGKALLDAIYIR